MKHEITLDDVIKSMDRNIVIAAAYSNKKQDKTLYFNPASLKYIIKYKDNKTGKEVINYYPEPLIAIEEYNECDV